jgi:hypothetical protein
MSTEPELEMKIAALDPTQFERLVFDVVFDENPTATRPRPPDEGADMLVLGSEGRAPRVWEAKRYTRTIKWDECEASLGDAIAGYAPESVTFVFAKDLTAREIKTLDRKLRALGADSRVGAGFWSLSALRARVQNNPHVRIRYFGHDRQTLLDIAAGRLASADPVSQAMNLEEAFGADDPEFEFEVELLRRPLPEPEESSEGITIMLREGPRTLRLAARPRKDDAGPLAIWGLR